MDKSFGKIVGWVAFVAGALWLLLGLWEMFGPKQEGEFFINIMVPIFAMISAFALLIRKN